MSDTKKKLLGLFRSRTSAGKSSKDSDKKDKERRSHRRERQSTSPSRAELERRSRHTHSPHAEPRRSIGSRTRPEPPVPLTRWPPPGFRRHGELSQGKAMELIASGIPVFKGHRREIPHSSDEYYTLYATCDGNGGAGSDAGLAYNAAFAAASFRLQGSVPAVHPWESLEQPSLEFCYGTRPGTITLNHWVGLSGNPNPPIELRDPGVKPREVELSVILERLIYLEAGFEEDYEDLMYKNLYRNLLRDPDRHAAPHRAMERQIADLIVVLSRPEWIDLSRAENQVVAKFFAAGDARGGGGTDRGGAARYKVFFHQLLLSTELDRRINSRHHAEWAKEKLLSQLPPSIAYDLVLARKWRECMAIEKFKTGGNPEQIRFNLRVKKAQVKALRKFARAMKWPNLEKVDDVLREKDADAVALEDRSSDTMSYFTGMIIPGGTLPWLVMNSLIDCDDDAGTADLAALSHMYPNSGFQYRSTTYWSSTSIVGKVLGPTCREIAGWVGPVRPAPDLSRVQIARIRQRLPKQHLKISHVESMTIRSDALGPPSSIYPVSEYQLPLPDLEYVVNTVRIEKLALKPVSSSSPSTTTSPTTAATTTAAAATPGTESSADDKPLTFDAAVQFAIDGRSWPLRLSYDVSYIAAYPCSRGPHPLFFDYVYRSVKVDEILAIKDWGGVNGRSSTRVPVDATVDATVDAPVDAEGELNNTSTSAAAAAGPATSVKPADTNENDAAEKVLVIAAFGVSDNEVLARAWCSHWGLSAIVADVDRTCMSCAIREAYAACLNVVILVETTDYDDDDE